MELLVQAVMLHYAKDGEQRLFMHGVDSKCIERSPLIDMIFSP